MEQSKPRLPLRLLKYLMGAYVVLYLVAVPLLAYFVIDERIKLETAKNGVLALGAISLALQLFVALPLYIVNRGPGSEQWVLSEMLVPGFLSGKSKAKASSAESATYTLSRGEVCAIVVFAVIAFVLPAANYGAVIAHETRGLRPSDKKQVPFANGEQLFLSPSSLAPRTWFYIDDLYGQTVVGIVDAKPSMGFVRNEVFNETGRKVDKTSPLRATFVVQEPTTVQLVCEEDAPARHQVMDRDGNVVFDEEATQWSAKLEKEGVYTLTVTPGNTASTVTANCTFTTNLYRYDTSKLVEMCDGTLWSCSLKCTSSQLIMLDSPHKLPNETSNKTVGVEKQSQFIPFAGYNMLQQALFFTFLPVAAFSAMAIVNLYRWADNSSQKRIIRSRTPCGCQFDEPANVCGTAACLTLLVASLIGFAWLTTVAAVGGYDLGKENEWRRELVLSMGQQKLVYLPTTITTSTVTVAGKPWTSVSAMQQVPPMTNQSYQYTLVHMYAEEGRPGRHSVEVIAGATLRWLIKADAEVDLELLDFSSQRASQNQSSVLTWQSSYVNKDQQNRLVTFVASVPVGNSSSSSSSASSSSSSIKSSKIRVDFESLTTEVVMMNRVDHDLRSCTGDCDLEVGKVKHVPYVLAEHTFQPGGSDPTTVTISAPNDGLMHGVFVTISATVCTIFLLVFVLSCAYNIVLQCKSTRIDDPRNIADEQSKTRETQLTESLLAYGDLSTTATPSSSSSSSFTTTPPTTGKTPSGDDKSVTTTHFSDPYGSGVSTPAPSYTA